MWGPDIMVRQTAGVTLIELMIVIAILAFLLLATLPFTSSWIYSARVTDGKNKLIQAYGLAKALALRNPNAALALNPAAGLRLDSLTLYVCSGDPTDATQCAEGKSAVVWSTDLVKNTEVSIGGATGDVQTIAIDNTGSALTSATYTITYGSENETDALY